MNDSTRFNPNLENKDDDKQDDNVNFFYNTNYISLEDNLEGLKERVDEDFYFQEDSICGLIKKMDDMKSDYIGRLDNIENEYRKILDSSQSVFQQISLCNKRVDEFEKMEKSFVGFIGNVRKLDEEVGRVKNQPKI